MAVVVVVFFSKKANFCFCHLSFPQVAMHINSDPQPFGHEGFDFLRSVLFERTKGPLISNSHFDPLFRAFFPARRGSIFSVRSRDFLPVKGQSNYRSVCERVRNGFYSLLLLRR